MKLKDVDAYIRSILDMDGFSRADAAINGLQVGRTDAEIGKVAFAVDACMESFRRAKEWGADLLFVHHGLFWGRQFPLVDDVHSRFSYLFSNGLSLYAAHLPLDAHPEIGNNAGLARELRLRDLRPFGDYKGSKIGLAGTLPSPLRIEEVVVRLFGDDRGTLGRLGFGKEFNETVGIVSGGAPDEVSQAIEQGLDLFITGDSDHTIYHRCLEAGINVIFGGHYQTEIWGVSLFARKMRAETGLETCFIDIPSGY